jgi:putative transcriptional regulator
MKMPSTGDFLIAEPFMQDPNFQRTVVLLCQKQEDGYVGFTINKKIDFIVGDLVEELADCTMPLFDGGPVGKEQMFFLHSMPELIAGGIMLQKDLYWGGDFNQVKQLVQSQTIDPNRIKFIVGYSGWEAGQLEDEMQEKSWLIAPATKGLVFQEQSEEIWKSAVKLLGEEFKPIINYPKNPSFN